VLVHDVILASGEDTVSATAARRAAVFALDALEGDAAFLTRTCDCRTISQAKKKQKQKTFENVLLDFEEEEKDILAVEQVLTGIGTTSSGRASEEAELEEGMIFE
jgi:endoribonuclease Dicer